ncbi:hypothetical protein PWT90_05173 [Aphanocladium album]|nr:hypothetical protein PWT90_05173 [Aphanocladium album]
MVPGPEGTPDRPIRRRFVADGRVRSGCLTCKARKKKCDGDMSSSDGRCKSCIRLGLICENAPLRRVAPRPPRRKSQPVDAQSASPGSDSLSPMASVHHQDDASHSSDVLVQGAGVWVNRKPSPPSVPGSSEGMQRILLRYFLDHVAPLCSILEQDGGNFCSVLLPMAFVDKSLLHALFAYASAHCNDSESSQAINMTPETHLEFENQVARGVADSIANDNVTETTLACALVISTAEVVRGETSRWQVHLEGAGHLVHHIGAEKLLETSDGTFLLRYFAYHDIMAALSTSRRTLVDGVYWTQDIEGKVTSADSFMGLTHHILKHLPEMCSFVADTKELDLSSCTDRRSRSTLHADDLAQTIRSQDLHLDVDSSNGYMKALINHAEAFRFATLFLLYRHILRFCDGAGVYKLRMADCVRQIFRYVPLIPANLFCELGLLYPLFVAGIGSMDNEESMKYVQERLKSIEAWSKFKHVARVRELLQALWDAGRTDWEDTLKAWNWHISLA